MFVILARISLLFGTFPYKYDQKTKFVHLSYYGAAMSIFVSLCSMWLVFDLFHRLALGMIVFNPQTILLSFMYTHISLISIVRLYRWRTQRLLFDQVLQYYHKGDKNIRKKKLILLFMVTVMVGEQVMLTFCFVWWLIHGDTEFLDSVAQLARAVLPLSFVIMCTASVEYQYAILCIILNEALHKVNVNLENMLKSGGETIAVKIEKNRRERQILMKIMKSANKEYGFVIFVLSNMLMLLAIYLSNDVMMIFDLIGSYTRKPSILILKIIYDVYCLLVTLGRLMWLGYESEKLLNEMKNTEKIIFMYHSHTGPRLPFEQIERCLYELNIAPNETALCGFFHLNMEFVFRCLGNITTFVLIFIQLNHTDKWVQ